MNLGFKKVFGPITLTLVLRITGHAIALMGGLTVQLLLNGSMRKSNNLFLTVAMIRTGNIIHCCKSCNTTLHVVRMLNVNIDDLIPGYG